MSRRILQWQQPAAELRNQTRQSTPARCVGGTSLAAGPLPAPLQADRQMAAYPGQRRCEPHWSYCHRRGPQKSHRSGGAPVGRRSVENQNRPAPSRRARVNQLKPVRGEQKGEPRFEQIKTLWNVGAARRLTCSECHFVCVGLDWACPCSSSTDRIDQMVPRLRDG